MNSNRGKLAIVVVAVLITVGCLFSGLKNQEQEESKKVQQSKSLVEAKAEYRTVLTKAAPISGSYMSPPPEGIRVVYYHSDGRQLVAWLAVPNLPGKHPALLWGHSGNTINETTIRDVIPFIQQGWVVMIPTWRGENGNTGNFEMCYGEVDDALAALNYLKGVPEADRNNLYAAGAEEGGTIMALLAESTKELKKVAVCGAYPDMSETGPYSNPPFDEKNTTELILRSPLRHVGDLGCPIRFICGSGEPSERKFLTQAQEMRRLGLKKQKWIEYEEISDLSNRKALELAVPLMQDFFKEEKK